MTQTNTILFLFQRLMLKYRPRKFSFDPKTKRSYVCGEESSDGPMFTKFFKNGVVVNKKANSSSTDDSSGANEIMTLSFLKSELTSNQDEDYDMSIDSDSDINESNDEAKTDEDAAEAP